MPNPIVVPHLDKAQLQLAGATRIINVAATAVAARGIAHLSLTGGTMGIAVLAGIAENPLSATVDWSKVHFWWSDERFVPRGHADRNEQQAKDAWLTSLGLPEENLHVMGASDIFDTPEEAAEAYTAELARYAPEGEASPLFGLTLLGMGPDGHIASLFPDRAEILEAEATALAVHNSPKPPPTRVSLTLPVINYSERIWFLVAGSDKAEATARLRAASALPETQLTAEILTQTPAAGARGLLETLILATEDALGSAS
ncbi:6-phosphogluconolactonase [Rothia nasimurium]|uniref:6-phosphogluconolactonase n=2 Tax=Rothia nasimurium TaxID=85336 RepID=UPI001F009367|nr:6-phosphogluconolactonase [Rothia nasimurium]